MSRGIASKVRPFRGLELGLDRLHLELVLLDVLRPQGPAADLIASTSGPTAPLAMSSTTPLVPPAEDADLHRGIADLLQAGAGLFEFASIFGSSSGLPPSTSAIVKPAMTPSAFALAAS